jgi:cell division protein ZapB
LISINFVPLTLRQAITIVTGTANCLQYTLMADHQLQVLEQKIDELIALCNQLNRENQALKADSAGWQRERQDLMDKNELARTRVEAMINRLREME